MATVLEKDIVRELANTQTQDERAVMVTLRPDEYGDQLVLKAKGKQKEHVISIQDLVSFANL